MIARWLAGTCVKATQSITVTSLKRSCVQQQLRRHPVLNNEAEV